MNYLDTPAGKFQILVNGIPADFEATPEAPYVYHNNDGTPIPITGCWQVTFSIQERHVGDTIIARFDFCLLTNDGGGEGMDNAVGYADDHVVGIGATDTSYLTGTATRSALPYENQGLNAGGFTFSITDDPKKYTAFPATQTIRFVIAWESRQQEYSWDIVSFMTS